MTIFSGISTHSRCASPAPSAKQGPPKVGLLTESVVRKRWICSDSSDALPSLSKCFEVLLDLALPVVKTHRGDLYWDALWLEKNAFEKYGAPALFYYSVAEYGTSIGFSLPLVALRNPDNVYEIRVFKDDRSSWWVTTEKVGDLS